MTAEIFGLRDGGGAGGRHDGDTGLCDAGQGAHACGGAGDLHRRADGHCSCDYGFHMAVTDWNAATRAELADMEREGVTSFKAYMAYENLRLGDRELLALFEATADIGVVGVHCELGDEVKTRVARLLAAGKTGPEWHPAEPPERGGVGWPCGAAWSWRARPGARPGWCT